jgi:benzodiazapine receptor
MNRRVIQQWANLAVVLATIAVNGLANAIPFNGQTTGEVSDKFDVLFVPAGYVFAIWGIIYLGLLAFGIYQVLPGRRENLRLGRIGYLFVLGSLANIAWLPLWHYERFPLSLVAMVVLLLSLIGIYLELDIGRARVPLVEKAAVDLPFSIYLGWITVATIANVTDVLDYVGWGGWGIGPEVWTIVMLLAGLAIAAAVSFTRGDIAYSAVLVWAYIGIAIKQSDTPSVVTGAWIIAALIALIAVIGALVHRRRQRMAVGAA